MIPLNLWAPCYWWHEAYTLMIWSDKLPAILLSLQLDYFPAKIEDYTFCQPTAYMHVESQIVADR